MEYKDYYSILNVNRDAPQEQVKQAYRKLARKYHPDISKETDAEEKFKDVNEAYEVLKDPEKRVAYDKFGSNWKNGQNVDPPPDWDAGFTFSGTGYTGAEASGFSDFFETLFGHSHFNQPREHRTTFRIKGEDQHAKVQISIRDAFHGSQQTLTLSRPVVDQQGHVYNKPQSLNVTIPKGIIEGQRIRLEGQGMPGSAGAPDGDLYLEVVFDQDPLYRADKRDIHIDLPVTPWEAALGATVTVPTLGGKVQLHLPPGSQGGKKLRLKGRGLSKPGQQGDQFITLRVVVPEAKTVEQQELYKKMASMMPTNPRTELGV